MIDKRIQIALTPNTTLDDVEDLIATARDEFFDPEQVRVGVYGDSTSVFLFAQVVV